MTKLYYEEKLERATRAVRHTEYMDANFKSSTEYSVMGTRVYSENSTFVKVEADNNTKVILTREDTVRAFMRFNEGKTAILNFASYKNPGGNFIGGSRAQEEFLCHHSNLYNILKQFENNYYAYNRKHLNQGMYTNRALYTPNVVFVGSDSDEEVQYGDVITCAAPNLCSSKQYYLSDEINLKVLRSRIKFILDIASNNGVQTLILGAFGCGVFKQNARDVATIFDELITEEYKCFNKVVYAVIDKHGENFYKFENVLKEHAKVYL